MQAIAALLAALSIPLGILNAFGGVVAGIWLAVKGEWAVIFLGLFVLFGGAFIVPLLLVPGAGLLGIGALSYDRGRPTLGTFFVLLSSLWTVALVIVWEVSIFVTFGRRAVSPDLTIPVWLWSYGAATGVWSWLASKEQQGGNGMAAVHAFAAQVAYLLFSFCILWLRWPLGRSVLTMAVPLILPLAFAVVAVATSTRNRAPQQVD